jgi:RimJ/RimL family protein N-acetyltransferase
VKPAYPVQTDRLLLRPFAATDFEALLAIQSRDDVTRHLYWDPRTAAEVREVLETKVRSTAIVAEGDNLSLAAVLRESGELIGDCSLRWLSAEHRQAEIGFIFHPDHHGHGYATEAAAALLALAFDELRVHRVIGRLEARNTASARVLERLGMRQEAHLVENEHVKGEWQSEVVYAVLDREWREP